jgi:5-methylcytosine-specific restriction protein B
MVSLRLSFKWGKMMEGSSGNDIIETCVRLLEYKKNMILTGAPGTGKTYVTAEIAVAICKEIGTASIEREKVMDEYRNLVDKKQIAFTTFHQSMDYEEFVEGIKPITKNGNITYEVKPGIFKLICKEAEKNLDPLSKTEETSYEIVRTFLKSAIEQGQRGTVYIAEGDMNEKNNGERTKYLYRIVDCSDDKIELNKITLDEAGKVKEKRCNQILQQPLKQPIKVSDVVRLLESGKKINNQGDIAAILDIEVQSCPHYLLSIYQEMANEMEKEIRGMRSASMRGKKEDGVPKFVLIIDEINRGNISKIFGELITLLEKDKRIGEENEIKVTLPYSPEGERFGVPSNLYIIGTMNTADRSIGQIDYALRRRFVFYNLESNKEVIKEYYEKNGKDGTKALVLFSAIYSFLEKELEKNEDLDVKDLMVGHSYFLCETEEHLKQRLEYEIIPLIKEYVKDGIIMVDKKTLAEEIGKWEKVL